ncbi:MAG: ABC transporter permease [Gammaproteobacteria bacterium]|jgi:putative ABC transport system permease protein|nr:ABC transporter permease [Gammaproteobacteria bacterium]MBT3722134.1 ABC transporter permease [Gammaproteobacteria bacterium]MBT4194615.1 ABC transporter permease [Gammaproteobacteria bacterium]MBT4448889.1 ABC transporter permease [Gammaproteobacteria bacterium]MBT4863119.1 ABC transporter permease [Gammaproteobacteria bacterium]
MKLLPLTLKSAWNRRLSLSLTVLSIAISIMLLLGVDQVRKEAKRNFINTISKTDLIVGARSGPVNLLLYSVFRIGNATNNVSWESFEKLSSLKQVKWAIPLSLGDSHRGYRVLGTNTDYFKYYRFGGDRQLEFAEGGIFSHVYQVVLGADVAASLGYRLEDNIVVSHGLSSASFANHDDKPFRVIGILKKTGTPLDRTLHVPLEGISAIHSDWKSGTRSPLHLNAQQALKMDLIPKEITAFMLGLKNRIATFRVQRQINEFDEEPLLAIVPGATLSELWRLLSHFEVILLAISTLVLVAGLIGMLTTIISSLNERRREMAILRAIGAHPYHIILLFMMETLIIVSLGIVLGIFLLYLLMFSVNPLLTEWTGLTLQIQAPDMQQWLLLAVIMSAGVLVSLVPGLIAYRHSLQDGLMPRL